MTEEISNNYISGEAAETVETAAEAPKKRLSSAAIADRAYEIGEPCAEALGLYLWDCEYVKEGREYYLRYTIDSEDGVSLDECEAFHRAVDVELDKYDLIDGPYNLECSSPGIERNIRTPEHYEACVGVAITVKLYTALDGKKTLTGELKSYEDGKIVIDDNGKDVELSLDMISKANVYYDYEEDLKK